MSEEDEAVIEVMGAMIEAIRSHLNDPCAVCGEVGDALPCINCDKLVCGDCGIDTRWCGKACLDESARLRRENGQTKTRLDVALKSKENGEGGKAK